MTAREDTLTVGYVSGLHGVNGWVKVYSYTDPPSNIFEYQPWIVKHKAQAQIMTLVDAKKHGAGLIARLTGTDDRDAAAALVGAIISITRDQLPAAADDEYYWADLVGLSVVTGDGVELGTVKQLLETGANDVMIVTGERERLIPWLPGDVIDAVDVANGRITVLWDPEF